MKVTYQSLTYNRNTPVRRYVRSDYEGGYRWCETDSRGWDIRQGSVIGAELPDAVRNAADARRGFIPSYVEWPL